MASFLRSYIERHPKLSKAIKPMYRITVGKWKDKKKQKILQTVFVDVFRCFDQAMKELDIRYWLEFGTLLGIVRENGVIKHDTDIDVGIFLHDYSEQISVILEKYGFIKIGALKSKTIQEACEETYSFKGISLDIFFFIQNDDKIYCYDFMRDNGLTRNESIQKNGGLNVRRIPLTFTDISYVSLFDLRLPIPEPVAQHLIDHYGPNYMKPDPSWTSAKHAYSAQFIDYSGIVDNIDK